MKKFIVLLIIFMLVFTGFGCANNTQRGAGIGATGGALIGAMAFGSHSWQAALIGAVGGAIIGGLVGNAIDSQEQAKTEAASTGRRTVYYDDKDRADESTPGPLTKTIYEGNQRTDCRKVTTRVYENGAVISDKTEEVCTATKSTNTY